MFDMLSEDWFLLLAAVVALFILGKAGIKKHSSDDTTTDVVDSIDFDDYDEDIGFEITIDGKTRFFSEAATVWVDSGSEIRLRTKVEPENMNGEFEFGNLPKHHRAEWSYDCFDGMELADLAIEFPDNDDDGTRLVWVDPHVSGSITIDCMIIDDINDNRYVASVAIVFTPVESEVTPEQQTTTPHVQLEQA